MLIYKYIFIYVYKYKDNYPCSEGFSHANKLFLLKHKDPPHQSLESAAPSLAQPAPQRTRTRTKTRTRTRIRTKVIIRIKVRIRIRTIIQTYGFIAKGKKDNKLKAARLIWFQFDPSRLDHQDSLLQ